MSNVIVIDKTKIWIEEFILKYSICPFARRTFDQNLIKFKVDNSPDFEPALFALTVYLRELSFIIESFSNAFLILPNWKKGFESFLDCVEYGYSILDEMNLDHLFQLVAFHPDFHYQNENAGDITNATNQSPYPMIHILKISEVSLAIEKHEDAHRIAIDNKKLLSGLPENEIFHLKSLKSI